MSSLVIARPGGEILQTIDLEAYELLHNPDGQVQFLPDGTQPDSLSNPFSVLVQPGRVLVADAGANDVLSIDRETGEISTFFVPPVVGKEVEACAEAPNNGGTFGCDPVPTGLAEGSNGLIYVSTLGAEVPGAGRVFVLTPEGKRIGVIEGLDSPTGVEVSGHGTVYVSNVLEGAPEGQGPPPPGFDPTTVGEVTRIAPDLSRSTAQVTMPTGLLIEDGKLYASAWSIASFLGLQDRGEIVRIDRGAFTPIEFPTPTPTPTPTTAPTTAPTTSPTATATTSPTGTATTSPTGTATTSPTGTATTSPTGTATTSPTGTAAGG
jgi:hypothetical protein